MIALSVFRTTGVAWASVKYPAKATEFRNSGFCVAALAAARAVAYAARAADAFAAGAAADAGVAAAAAADGFFGSSFAVGAIDAALAAARAADPTAAVFWSAVSDDSRRVEGGLTASEVAGWQLWPQHLIGPEPLMSLWNEMEAALLAEKQDWMVWTTWYRDRLAGYVREEERELAYVRIDNDLWDQGPAVVNAEIKRRIEEHTTNPPGSFVSVGNQPARAAGEHEPPLRVENVPSLDEQRSWSNTLANLPEVPLGNKWIESGNRLAIDPAGQETDDVAARDPVVCQLHEAVKRKARAFADAEADIDDRLGWTGFGDAIQRFLAAVDVDTAAIPSRIAAVYDATIVLASFLDVDSDLRLRLGSNISPLDPITRRSFLDLVRTAAPWIRRFPTACALDDETGAFLLRRDLYEPSLAIVEGARQTDLISADDRALLKGLLSAIEREGFPAQKAGKRGIQSAKSLTFAAVAIVVTLV